MKLTVGSLAYFDSFSGMIPCKVLSISGNSGRPSLSQDVVVRITANRGPYKRGEKIETYGIHAVPRKAFHYVGGVGRIKAYTVESPTPQQPTEGIRFDLVAY